MTLHYNMLKYNYKIKNMSNTKNRGKLRFIFYKKAKDKKYTGACLELGLIDESPNLDYLKESLVDAARGYVENIITHNLDAELLNQPAPKEYWKMYKMILKEFNKPQQNDAQESFVFSIPALARQRQYC